MDNDTATAATIVHLRDALAASQKERNEIRKQLDGAEWERDAARDTAETLRQQLEAARSYIDGQDVRSDFPNATAMRAALNTARERAGVLEAEVRAWHAAEHLRKDEPHNEFMRLAEARARTRDTHAIDAAKFGGAT